MKPKEGIYRKFLLPTKDISQATSHFSMGFAKLRMANSVQHAESAGSGTFVSIGSLHGILTAAHVLDALEGEEYVGIILHGPEPERFQRQAVNLKLAAAPVLLRAGAFGPLGPDLAFLALPDETTGWLKAKASFYNLSKRRTEVLSNKHPTSAHVEVIVGIVDELTVVIPSDDALVRRVQFSAIFGSVKMSAVRYLSDRALNYFALQGEPDPGFSFPGSFAGVSGGAIWRFYVKENAEGAIELVDSRLIAVPFYENHDTERKRQIICHGSKDIYGRLIDEVSNRWPQETQSELQ